MILKSSYNAGSDKQYFSSPDSSQSVVRVLLKKAIKRNYLDGVIPLKRWL